MGGAGGVHAARLCQFLELLLSCEPSGLLPSRGRGLPSHPGCPPALRACAGRQGEGLWELGSRASRPSSLSLPPWLICTLPLPAPPTGCLASGGQCPPAGPCLLLVTQGKIQPRHACYVALICPCPTWSHLRPRRVATPPGLPRASAVPTRVPSQSQPPPTQGTCPPSSPVLPPHHYTGMCRRDLGPPHAIVNAGPSPHLHPRQAQACPLPPAGSPNTPVYLWASARDGSAPDSHPPPAHLPSHPFSPALQLSLFLLEVSVPVCVWGWGRRGIPVLRSAGAWPSAPGQRGMGGCGGPRRLPDSPRVAGACGGLPGGTEQALGVGGEGPQGPSSCPRPSPPSRLRIHGGGRMGQRRPVRGQKGGFFFGKTCRQHPRMNSRGASHHTVSSQSGDSRR